MGYIERIVAALLVVLRLRGDHGRPLVLTERASRNVESIVREARAVDDRPEFVQLVLAVCVVESGAQLRQPRAALCGCQPYDTSGETQARCAARSLATALSRCGSPERAVNRYVWGQCRQATSGRWRLRLIDYRARVRRVTAALLLVM